jgi:hypothetical protein
MKKVLTIIKNIFSKFKIRKPTEVKVDTNVSIPIGKVYRTWFQMGLVITLVCGIFYVILQQYIRLSANMEPTQIAHDTAAVIVQGNTPPEGLAPNSLDLTKSLAPYIVVFDDAGKPIYSTAQLNGKMPTLPKGVFDYTKKTNEDSITWQPQANIRQAVVIVHYSGPNPGFVLAGHSLTLYENTTQNLMYKLITGWAGALLITLVFAIILEVSHKKASKELVQ